MLSGQGVGPVEESVEHWLGVGVSEDGLAVSQGVHVESHEVYLH